MSKQKNNVKDLLAAINRQPTRAAPEMLDTEKASEKRTDLEEPTERATGTRVSLKKKPKSRKGGPVQFWMHDEDRVLVRELAAWLAGQGLRTTDSLVIRAALRQAKTGNALIEAYWEAAKLDGRLKRH
jgi:hypothetical protein